MAHYNHKLISQIDKFFRLAQQADPDDDLVGNQDEDDVEQQKIQLQKQWQDFLTQMRGVETEYGQLVGNPKGGGQAIRNDIRQRTGKGRTQPAQQGQEAQPGQQAAKPVAATPEQSITAGLINGKVYATINGNKGDLAKPVNDKVVQLIDSYFLSKGDVRKIAKERMAGFSIRVTVAPSGGVHVELFITDPGLKAQYINDFNKAWRAVLDYLSPVIANNIQYTMRKLDIKIDKSIVIDHSLEFKNV